jgi:Fasciclin domain
MIPIRWRNGLADPFQDFEDLQEEFNRLFDLTRAPEPRGIFDRAFYPAADVMKLITAKTVNGQSVTIQTSGGVKVNGANVVAADIPADNGVIHMIDNVILPR